MIVRLVKEGNDIKMIVEVIYHDCFKGRKM